MNMCEKVEDKEFPAGIFFPLGESDTVSLSARYFLSSHTQSSGLKTLHVSSGTGHHTRIDRKAEEAERQFGFMEIDAGSQGMFWPSCHDVSHMIHKTLMLWVLEKLNVASR